MMITSVGLSPIEAFRNREPGIYPGIPGSVYHGLDAVSNSRLKPLTRSPEHCRHAIDNGVEETDALRFGSGTHAWILEPETLETDFVVAQQCSAIVKSSGQPCSNGGKLWDGTDWFCGQHGKHLSPDDLPEQTVIPSEQWDQMATIRDRIYGHESARVILEADGDNELSVIAEHAITGLTCKMRFDGCRLGLQTIFDIKTCQDASRDAFEQSIFKFGYYRQAGMYLRLAQQSGLNVEHFVFIAVEKKAPHSVGVYRLTDDVIEQGWEDTERLLHLYSECEQANHWPGYSDEVQDISLPAYAWRKLLDEANGSE